MGYEGARVIHAGIQGHYLVIVQAAGWHSESVLCTCYSRDDGELIARMINSRAAKRKKP